VEVEEGVEDQLLQAQLEVLVGVEEEEQLVISIFRVIVME
jgi:hypothetical protein